MKDIDLTAVFCEVLSGIGLVLMLVPLLDITGAYSLDALLSVLGKHLSAGTLAAGLVAAYLLGAIVDALGIILDEQWIGQSLAHEAPTREQRGIFLNNVQEHILKYRDQQWTWFCCYRNLFFVFLPAGVFWVILLYLRSHYGLALGVLVSATVTEAALYRAMKVLLSLYFEITKSIKVRDMADRGGDSLPIGMA